MPTSRAAPEPIDRQGEVLAGIAKIFCEALTCTTPEGLYRVCLAVAEEVTQSKIGFLAELNHQTGKLDAFVMSDSAWSACRVQDPALHGKRLPTGFAIHGIYGRALRDGKGFFTNAPSSHPDRVGTPPGHPPLTAFLGVPLVHAGEAFGMVGLANREGGYGPEPLKAAEALAPAIVQAILGRRMEEALRESEAKIRAAFENASFEFWVRDAEGRCIMQNTGAKRHWGEQIGKRVEESGSPEDVIAVWQANNRRAFGGEVVNEDIECTCDGRRRVYHNVVAPFRVGSEIRGVLGFNLDITGRKRAERSLVAALAGAQELESIVNRSTSMVFRWRAQVDFPIVYVSANVSQLGYTAERLLSGQVSWVGITHPEDEPRLRQELESHAAEGRDDFLMEYRIFDSDGHVRWMSDHTHAVRGAYGNIEYYESVTRDITERKQAEHVLQQRLAAERLVAAVSGRLVNVPATGLDAAIDDAVADVGRLMEVDRCFLFHVSDDLAIADNTHEWCAPGVSPQKDDLRNVPTARFWWMLDKMRGEEPLSISRTADLPPEAASERQVLASGRTQSVLLVPVRHTGRLTALIGVDSVRTERRWSGQDSRLLRTVGELLTDAQARCCAEQALRESEERYRTLAEAARDMIFIIGPDDKVQYVNTYAAGQLGLRPEDMTGQARSRFFPAATGERQAANLRRVRETGQPLYAEGEPPFRGKPLWLGTSLVPIRDASGAVHAVLGIARDITDRKRAESALKSLNETLEKRVEERTEAMQVLHDVASIANQSLGPHQAIEYCLRRVVAYTGWSFGHALRPAGDDAEVLTALRVYYPEEPACFLRFRAVTLGMRFRRGEGLVGRVFASGKPAWTNDVRCDLLEPRGVVAEELGIGTAIAFPVLVGEKVVAVLEFFSDQVLQPDGRILDAMAGVGMQLGRVIERAHFEEHLLAIAEDIQQAISQDLHDDVGQELTGLGLKAETLAEMLPAADEPAGRLAADIAAAVDRTRCKIRGLSRRLLPVELEKGLLAVALRQFTAMATAGSGIACTFDDFHPDPVFSSRVATQLFRIVQEAVTNAVRHSGAQNIRVTLDLENSHTVLAIEDDGAGLPAKAVRAEGLGLRTMRYRAGLIGANLEIGAGASGGTRVVCRLPAGSSDRGE